MWGLLIIHEFYLDLQCLIFPFLICICSEFFECPENVYSNWRCCPLLYVANVLKLLVVAVGNAFVCWCCFYFLLTMVCVAVRLKEKNFWILSRNNRTYISRLLCQFCQSLTVSCLFIWALVSHRSVLLLVGKKIVS